MAGGDGSLAAVAEVAIERDLPFVCIPFGTRNHFARDLGLDRDDPIGALAAFDDGVERRVDVGRAGDRLFLNNVSLGLYARLVHRREHHRRRRDALARLRALALTAEGPAAHASASRSTASRCAPGSCSSRTTPTALDLLSLGERERLDEGMLHLYVPHGFRRITWEERSGAELELGAPSATARAAVDGEPVELDTPIEFRIEPRALRVLVPRAPEPEDLREVEERELVARRQLVRARTSAARRRRRRAARRRRGRARPR